MIEITHLASVDSDSFMQDQGKFCTINRGCFSDALKGKNIDLSAWG
jgi:hypothetical protein